MSGNKEKKKKKNSPLVNRIAAAIDFVIVAVVAYYFFSDLPLSKWTPEHYKSLEWKPVINSDVFIIGSGVHALILNRMLRHKGYGVLMLAENGVGEGNSLQNHGWLHTGYMFPNVDLAHQLRQQSEFWEHELESLPTTLDTQNKFLVPTNESFAAFVSVYQKLGLTYKNVTQKELPEIFQNGLLSSQKAFEIYDGTFRDDLVVKGLANPLITNIVNGELISVTVNESNYVNTAEVKLPDGKILSINTRFVVYAADHFTTPLLQKLKSMNKETREKLDKAAQAFNAGKGTPVICIRGDEGTLPSVGVFHLPSKTLVSGVKSQKFADLGTKKNIWYAMKLAEAGPKAESEEQQQKELVKENMKNVLQLLPGLEKNLTHLEFTVFTGYRQGLPKHETGTAELFVELKNVVVSLHSSINNILSSAEKTLELISKEVPEGKEPQFDVSETLKIISNGKFFNKVQKLPFDTAEWKSWSDFKRSYNIE